MYFYNIKIYVKFVPLVIGLLNLIDACENELNQSGQETGERSQGATWHSHQGTERIFNINVKGCSNFSRILKFRKKLS